MAKVTEGDPYYYAPISFRESAWRIYKKNAHPNAELMCPVYNQEHASLIVDALNFMHYFAQLKNTTEYRDITKGYVQWVKERAKA